MFKADEIDQTAQPSTWASAWKKLRMVWPYVWPKGYCLMQLRVLFCIMLLVAGRVINVFVPFLNKLISKYNLIPCDAAEVIIIANEIKFMAWHYCTCYSVWSVQLWVFLLTQSSHCLGPFYLWIYNSKGGPTLHLMTPTWLWSHANHQDYLWVMSLREW